MAGVLRIFNLAAESEHGFIMWAKAKSNCGCPDKTWVADSPEIVVSLSGPLKFLQLNI